MVVYSYYTIKSRSSLMAPAHPGGPRKRAVKCLWWWWWYSCCMYHMDAILYSCLTFSYVTSVFVFYVIFILIFYE